MQYLKIFGALTSIVKHILSCFKDFRGLKKPYNMPILLISYEKMRFVC